MKKDKEDFDLPADESRPDLGNRVGWAVFNPQSLQIPTIRSMSPQGNGLISGTITQNSQLNLLETRDLTKRKWKGGWGEGRENGQMDK